MNTFQQPAVRCALVVIGLLVFALVQFRAGWPAGVTIASQDFNIGVLSGYNRVFPADWFHGSWDSSGLLGVAGTRFANLTNLLLVLLPVETAADVVYPLLLTLAATGMWVFVWRQFGHASAGMVAALAVAWFGSNLTLVHPGHLYKFGVLAWAAWFPVCWSEAVRRRSWAWGLTSGCVLAMMFYEQQDMAVLFSLLLAAWALFAAWREWGRPSLVWIPPVLAGALAALVLVTVPFLHAKAHFIDDAAITTASAEERWNWATSWSWPASESIEFAAPGYSGWRSTHPQAPYWGKVGQPGGPYFRGEGQYLGLPMLLLAWWGLFAAWSIRKTAPRWWHQALFWNVAAGICWLLSLGRFFILYKLFFSLPLMGSIRAPIKFQQPMQLALAVAAAIGVALLLGPRARDPQLPGLPTMRRRFGWGILGILAVLALLLLVNFSSVAGFRDQLATLGLQTRSKALFDTRIAGLLNALVLGAGTWGLFWAAGRWSSPRAHTIAAAALIGVMGVDSVRYASRYIEPLPLEAVQHNPVADFLNAQDFDGRVAALQVAGPYQYLLTYTFPYHGIPYANILAAPRLHQDYRDYLQAIGNNLPRQWRHFAVDYVLLPRSTWNQLAGQPGLSTAFEPVFGFNADPTPEGSWKFTSAPVDRAAHLVLRHHTAFPRGAVLHQWRTASREEVRQYLANPRFDFGTTTLVQADLPDPTLPATPPAGTSVQISRVLNGFDVTVTTPIPAVLRCADRFFPDTTVTLDGQPVEQVRCDLLFAGAYVPAGTHVVSFRNTSSPVPVYLQLAVLLAGFVAPVAFGRRRKDPTDEA